MENSLGRFRKEFGWSQEAMAAALGVSVKTLSRWEGANVSEMNPFLSLVWASVSRYSSRLYRYAKAVIPADFIASVRADSRERSLLVGPEAVVLVMSDATKRNWGVYRYYEGLSVAAFMSPETKQMHANSYDLMRANSDDVKSTVVFNMITKDAPLGSTPPLWRRHRMKLVYPLVYDLVSKPISEDEYLSTEQKIWVD